MVNRLIESGLVEERLGGLRVGKAPFFARQQTRELWLLPTEDVWDGDPGCRNITRKARVRGQLREEIRGEAKTGHEVALVGVDHDNPKWIPCRTASVSDSEEKPL